jgi:Zn-dependent peptidase ImmA (M78 family)
MARLAALKTQWGISIAALVRRARDVGAIGESEYRSLNIELSAAGMRKAEPVELPPERPSLTAHVVSERLESGETLEDIAAATLVSEADLLTRYLETS